MGRYGAVNREKSKEDRKSILAIAGIEIGRTRLSSRRAQLEFESEGIFNIARARAHAHAHTEPILLFR